MPAYVVLHNTVLDVEAMMNDYIPKALRLGATKGFAVLVDGFSG